MNFVEYFEEATRRDFLKKIGGAIAGSAVPAPITNIAKATAAPVATAAATLPSFGLQWLIHDVLDKMDQFWESEGEDFDSSWVLQEYLDSVIDLREKLPANSSAIGLVNDLIDKTEGTVSRTNKIADYLEDNVTKISENRYNALYNQYCKLVGSVWDKYNMFGVKLVEVLYKGGLMDEETIEQAEMTLETDLDDMFPKEPTDDIEYSRIDYAGGSEDDDYGLSIEGMTYKDFFLEYYKGNPILNPRFTNGKDVNRIASRKNMNTKPEVYTNMHPDVDAAAKGRVDNKQIKGIRLQQLLKMYNIEATPGTKGLGRTHAVLVLRQTPEGLVGVIKQK